MPKRISKMTILFASLLIGTQMNINAAPLADDNGTLRAQITLGDMDNTPGPGVYVEAHGYSTSSRSYQSFVFKMLKPGRYEVSLTPGLYDVFISDGSSIPQCRRMRVTSGEVSVWTVKLRLDEAHLNH
jgi:hypothetical protein